MHARAHRVQSADVDVRCGSTRSPPARRPWNVNLESGIRAAAASGCAGKVVDVGPAELVQHVRAQRVIVIKKAEEH